MKLALLVSACLLFGACGHEAGESLGNGYLQVSTDTFNTWVVRGSEAVIDSNVTAALAIEDYIVGLRVRPTRFVSHRENEISDEYGFFLFDKSTGVLVQGLTETEMEKVFEANTWDFKLLEDVTK